MLMADISSTTTSLQIVEILATEIELLSQYPPWNQSSVGNSCTDLYNKRFYSKTVGDILGPFGGQFPATITEIGKSAVSILHNFVSLLRTFT